MRKLLFGLALVVLLAGCGQTRAKPPPKEEEEPDEYEVLISATPVAEVEGEAVSPDGRFEVRTRGASGQYVSGVQPPEFLQIVNRETGEVLWQNQGWLPQSALWSPKGGFLALAYSAQTWGSCFACRVNGKDYLLRYLPTMYQGFAAYEYELFSLSEPGEEAVIRKGTVSFDINFGSPMHDFFNPTEITAFLEEVHGLLEDSALLLTTEGGEFRSGGSGADFKDDLACWTDDPLYDHSKSLAENIRGIGAYWEKQQTME